MGQVFIQTDTGSYVAHLHPADPYWRPRGPVRTSTHWHSPPSSQDPRLAGRYNHLLSSSTVGILPGNAWRRRVSRILDSHSFLKCRACLSVCLCVCDYEWGSVECAWAEQSWPSVLVRRGDPRSGPTYRSFPVCLVGRGSGMAPTLAGLSLCASHCREVFADSSGLCVWRRDRQGGAGRGLLPPALFVFLNPTWSTKMPSAKLALV